MIALQQKASYEKRSFAKSRQRFCHETAELEIDNKTADSRRHDCTATGISQEFAGQMVDNRSFEISDSRKFEPMFHALLA